ncbi:MAG: hypothetical protein ACLU4H_10415 [Hominilimicola sp.]|uniref:hypothetical protein n=1 Tax=Hominilimicola sp. TaxID=3073571 RepID=UPI00399A8798
MKLKKFITLGLAAVMATSAIGINAIAADSDNEIVYSYADENNNIINITQSDLDAEHWNKEALGDTAPAIYENFPMNMTGYSNDVAELYLDFEYMKNLKDMDSVHLEITKLSDDSLIYNEDLQQESFYSPQIFAGESYKVTLTETVDGNSKSYSKGVIANESEIDMPEYVTNPDTDDESIIMVGDIEDLKSGKISTGNSISVDTNVAQYAHIKANEFKEYYSNLPSNKVYRIYTISNGDVYSGYMSTEDDIKFYDLTIDSCDWDSFYSPTLLSIPSYTTTDIKNNAVDARYTEYCYKLSETSNNSKCKIFKVAMPDSFFNEKNPPVFRVVVKGQSKVTAKIWYSADNGTLNSVVSRTSNNNTNTISYPLESLYNAKKSIYFYVMVYLTDEVSGYVSVSFEDVSGYGDDVTGSAYEAYNGASSYTSMPNTEFTMTDSWDVDTFYIDYPGTKNCTYKIELRNRSLKEQEELESGNFDSIIKGSRAKYLVLQTLTDRGNMVSTSDYAIYAVEKGVDCSVYNQVSRTGANIISIYEQKFYSGGGEKYQLALTRYMGNN